ncbi:permease [Rhabdaerophilum calidifontis]|uniref:permease n=1 Tax=Rhabdaerophilum calidifontis TaxID=2604328 RepID=UPI00123AB4D3|nr:permease [Rhabdaerophilum calidifontis]
MRTLPFPIHIARPDPVLLTLVAVFAGLALFAPAQAEASLAFVLRAVLSVLPLFLLSIAIAAYAAASGADNLIARAFAGNAAIMVVSAALMGALSPFCSCGVIPLIAALLAMGVPLAPVMAFWLASPLMDPAMFVLTASILGTGFAIGKTIAAIAVGLIGGLGTLALQRLGLVGEVLREGVGNGGCAGGKIRAPKPVLWPFWREPARRETFRANALKNIVFLGKMLILAFTLESLMVAYLPPGLVVRLLGGEGPGAILVATLVGIPAYLNGTAALPLVRELIGQGMAPGAGMAFLIAGGVTSIPAAIAVHAVARRPVFIAYLGFALLGALLSGLAWQQAARFM